MTFAMLIAIVPEEHEETAIEYAKEAGAGGATILHGAGIGFGDKKTFLGLAYEENESLLLFVLEKKTSLKVLKNITTKLEKEHESHALGMTINIDHIGGIDKKQVSQFREQIKDKI